MIKHAHDLHTVHTTILQKKKQSLSTTQQKYPSTIEQRVGGIKKKYSGNAFADFKITIACVCRLDSNNQTQAGTTHVKSGT